MVGPASLEDVMRITTMARSMCPNVTAMRIDYCKNYTFGQNLVDEAPRTLCDLWQLTADIGRYVGQSCYVTLTLSLIGMLNCLSALVILSDTSCKEPTFLYHRAINLCDFFYLTFMAMQDVAQIATAAVQYSYAWRQLTRFLGGQLDIGLTETVEALVIWMSVERVACYFPALFRRLNQRWVAKTVIAISFVISLSANVPRVFSKDFRLNNASMTFDPYVTSFVASGAAQTFQEVKATLALFRGVCVAIGATATVVVYLLIVRLKRRLAAQMGDGSATAQNLVNDIKIGRMLSILQICESVPLIIGCCYAVSVAVSSSSSSSSPFIDDREFLKVSRRTSLQKITSFKVSFYLRIGKLFFDRVSHSVHFLLYVVFSVKIRRIARRKIRFWTSTHTSDVCVLPQLDNR